MKKNLVLIVILNFLLTSCLSGTKMYKCYPTGNLNTEIRFYFDQKLEGKNSNFKIQDINMFEKINDSLVEKVWMINVDNEKPKNGYIEYGQKFRRKTIENFKYDVEAKKLKKNSVYEISIGSLHNSINGSNGIGGCKFKIDDKGNVINMPNTKE